MGCENINLLLQMGIPVGAAFLGAWLGAKRFRNERWWERKVESYTDLIEALHEMKWPTGKYIDTVIENRKLSDNDWEEYWKIFDGGSKNARNVAERSSFLISSEVLREIREMEKQLSIAQDFNNSFDYLNKAYEAIDKCLQKVKEIGAKELGIDNS